MADVVKNENEKSESAKAENNKNKGWKKVIIAILIIIPFIISLKNWGPIKSVVVAFDYADLTIEYVSQVREFSKELPSLTEKAADNEKDRIKLEETLVVMKVKAEDYNDLPRLKYLKKLQGETVNRNIIFINGLEEYIKDVKNGNPGSKTKNGLMEKTDQMTVLLDENDKINQEFIQ